MWSISPEYIEAIKYSHRITQRVEVYEGLEQALIYKTDDMTLNAGLLDGEVSISNDPSGRTQARFQIFDRDGVLTPGDYRDIFTPYGHEVRIYRGVKRADGSILEEFPLGTLRLNNVEINDAGLGINISCQANDRARTVSRAKFTNDLHIAAGTNYADAIELILKMQVAGLITNFISTSFVTPNITILTGDDPWEKASTMAAAIGCELYFDALGFCTMHTVQNSDAEPTDWIFTEGEDATILYLNKRLTDADAYNWYTFIGENSDNAAPVRGDAWDDNPLSATYYRGSYGIVPAPITRSKLITSTGQAIAAAQGALQRSIGYSERIHFNAIVNAAHVIGDVVEIVRPKSKVNARYVIDQFSIPLTHNRAMDAVTRRRQATV